MTLEQLGLGLDPPNGSGREKGATEILHGGIAHLWRDIKMEQFATIVV